MTIPNAGNRRAERSGESAVRKDSRPKYRLIEEDLRRRIGEAQWLPGAMLPGRSALAREYDVDLTTLQRAVSALLEDGTLRADPRRGTFVGLPDKTGKTVSNRLPDPPLRTHPGGSIGLVASADAGLESIDTIRDEWQHVLLRSAERALAAENRVARFLNRRTPRAELSLFDALGALAAENIRAALVVGITEQSSLAAEIAAFVAANPAFSLVLVSWHAEPLPVPCVFYDSLIAGYQAALHLLALGHRHITFFSPFQPTEWSDQRRLGACRALLQNGLDPDHALVVRPAGTGQAFPFETENQTNQSRRAASALLGLDLAWLKNGAVIAANDSIAFGLMDAAAAHGLAAGRDYALIGFDDGPKTRTRGLTSLRPPLETMGEEAARLLLASGTRRGQSSQSSTMSGAGLQVRLASELIPRASTAV